jgi:phosphoribosylglycinamide formyltransferase-1
VTKIAVFASGRGSNFQTIYKKIKEGFIPAQIVLLITDNDKAGAITFAFEHNIPFSVVKPKDFYTSEIFGVELLRLLELYEAEFIILAGYLKKIPSNVIDRYQNRIVNIHPALLPSFGGKGMYGHRVHEAVFNSGVKLSGVTVHLVNNEYDAGPIVLQRAVNIEACNLPEEIAAEVLKEEHKAFPEALKRLLENEVIVEGQRVIIRKPKHVTN